MQQKTQQPQTDDTAKPAAHRSTVILLLITVADTTWRLFIPTIGGAVLGLVIDNQQHTKPWATVIGVVTGTILAFFLLYLQLKKVNREKKS